MVEADFDASSSSAHHHKGLKYYFPSLTKQTAVRHYIPMSGAVSHAAFGCYILNPDALARVFPVYDVAIANATLISSNIGIGLYLFHRAHMRKVSQRTRVMYCTYTAGLFNFGSVLLWAATKQVLPRNAVVRFLFGALTSACLLAIGKEYLAYIDFIAADVNGADFSS